jgi:hypothetical protein
MAELLLGCHVATSRLATLPRPRPLAR